MKRFEVIIIIVAVRLVILTTPSLAQEQENDKDKLPVIGIGLHLEQLKWMDISSSLYYGSSMIMPSNKMIITVNATEHFRIEPEIGFSSRNNKAENLKSSAFSFGLGLIGMKQKGKTNIYGGLRIENASGKNENDDYTTSGASIKSEEKINRFIIGAVIGGEYFLGQHFSFGGEVGVKNMTTKVINPQYAYTILEEDNQENVFTLDSGLSIRFYF